MKTKLILLAVLIMAASLTLTACDDLLAPTNHLAGTEWFSADKTISVSFTKDIITLKDPSHGTSSASYAISYDSADATSFNITSGLFRGDTKYTSGTADFRNECLLLEQKGGYGFSVPSYFYLPD